MQIVVGVDESVAGCEALRWAARVAARSGATLEAARCWMYPDVPVGPLASPPVMDETVEAALESTIERCVGPDHAAIRTTVVRGPAAHGLVSLIDRRRPSLVVVGRRGDERTSPHLLGSVSRRLVETARCPTVVVSGDAAERLRDDPLILVGVDGSASAQRALEWAAHFARQQGGTILLAHVVGVVTSVGQMETLKEETNRLLARAGDLLAAQLVPFEVVKSIGDPRRVIEELAIDSGVDLIVVGPRGMGAMAKLVIGTVADYLTQHSSRPVAIVPTGWEPV